MYIRIDVDGEPESVAHPAGSSVGSSVGPPVATTSPTTGAGVVVATEPATGSLLLIMFAEWVASSSVCEEPPPARWGAGEVMSGAPSARKATRSNGCRETNVNEGLAERMHSSVILCSALTRTEIPRRSTSPGARCGTSARATCSSPRRRTFRGLGSCPARGESWRLRLEDILKSGHVGVGWGSRGMEVV